MEHDFNEAVELLKKGQPPGNREVLQEISIGIDTLVSFITNHYFKDYISSGGSKIKFITGKPGSGKTHFLQMLTLAASDQDFVPVHISAKEIWLHDFKEIYTEVFRQTNLTACLELCAANIAAELGHEFSSIPSDMTFADYLSSLGELDVLTKKEIRNQLRVMFLQNPVLDNNFAIACSLLTGGILGHPALEESNKALLLSWLSGSKEAKLPALRSLGMSPARVTKFNARHMLRSLLEVLKMAGLPGVIVMVDNMEVLVNASSLDVVRYTKMRRDDAYWNIRELIDDIDTLNNIMFFFAFDRLLLDDERTGLKSYHALWLRMQNEIVSSRFNKFTDIYDVDKYGADVYDKSTLAEMSKRFADVMRKAGDEVEPIDELIAEELISDARYTNISLPRQVVIATLEKKDDRQDPFGGVEVSLEELKLYERF